MFGLRLAILDSVDLPHLAYALPAPALRLAAATIRCENMRKTPVPEELSKCLHGKAEICKICAKC